MNKLERVLKRNDVVVHMLVQVIHHSSQSCRFSRIGRTCDEYETAFL